MDHQRHTLATLTLRNRTKTSQKHNTDKNDKQHKPYKKASGLLCDTTVLLIVKSGKFRVDDREQNNLGKVENIRRHLRNIYFTGTGITYELSNISSIRWKIAIDKWEVDYRKSSNHLVVGRCIKFSSVVNVKIGALFNVSNIVSFKFIWIDAMQIIAE